MIRRPSLYVLVLLLLVFVAAFAGPAYAGSHRNVDDFDRVPVRGNVHPFIKGKARLGHTDANLSMEKMVLVLSRTPEKQAALDTLIAQQHDPSSPLYQQWLTPEEFGQRFGLSDDDLASVTQWLESYGFRIDEVAPGRGWINFSGNVDQVERAFQTEIDDFEVNGHRHHANSKDPTVPRALADLVHGVLTLHDFRKTPANTGFSQIQTNGITPDYTSGSSHYLAPADFATIYNLKPLYNSSINGSGQTIAIVGRTEIKLADVQYFRSYFGLPSKDPVFVNNGTSPGNLGGGEEGEADLDVQWAGAVAPSATVKFVISKSTTTTDGVDLSAQYIVNNNLASVMSTSFGQCESTMGSSEMSFYNNLWSQAAAQGITSFVSSGDSGAAGCSAGSASSGSGKAVSGLCSTPYNVCVGGTQFADTTNPSLYWASANNSTDKGSALSYIPEIVWNESGSVSGGSGLWASGGGVSNTYAKPSWQVAPGVPADGKRDVPDVSLAAAGHDGYIVVQGHTSSASGLSAVGGTSASSPSFAGLMALVVQKKGARQGNANTVFYPMAVSQYNGSGPVVYHDITSGNNTVPGVTGYNAGTGYDASTGLGSVDGNALVNNWGSTTTNPDFTLSLSSSSASVVAGNSTTATVTTAVAGGFSSAVALTASGQPTGVTVSFNPTSIAAPGSGTSTMTVTVASTATAGTYNITVTGTGGSKTHTATFALTVTTGGTNPSQLLLNPGFESGSANWTATSGVISAGTSSQPAHSGSYMAWLDGYGSTHTDSLYQQVTIPSTATKATLSFWLHIDTAETTTTTAYDKLQVQIRNSSGTVLATLATYSNLNKTTGYTQKSFDVSSYKGQTIRVYFVGTEDSSLQTSFVIDDTALNVQ